MQVVEHHQRRCRSTCHLEPRAQRADRERRIRVTSGRRADHGIAQRRNQPRQLRGPVAKIERPLRLFRPPREEVDDRTVRSVQIFVAATGQHQPALIEHLHGQLGYETGLADARLPRHQNQMARTLLARLPRVGERGQLLAAAGKCERRAGQQQRRQATDQLLLKGIERLPQHLVGEQRIRQSLQLQLTHRTEPVIAPTPSEAAHQRRAQDLIRRCRGLQPLRLDNGETEAVAVGFDRHVTDTEPDPHRESRPVITTVVIMNRLMHRHRGTHRVGRARKRRHNTVAGRLDDRSATALDRARDQGIVGVTQPVRSLFAQPAAMLGRAHQIGEQHRQSLDPTRRPAITHEERDYCPISTNSVRLAAALAKRQRPEVDPRPIEPTPPHCPSHASPNDTRCGVPIAGYRTLLRRPARAGAALRERELPVGARRSGSPEPRARQIHSQPGGRVGVAPTSS